MFELLTWLLLWALILYILWYIFSKFINKVYLTWLGGLIVLAFFILAFLDPTNSTVGTIWGVLSLPLKPLGLTIFLLLSAVREGTKKIAANQVVAALLILFFTSTPIVAYWLMAQTERSANTTVQLEGAQAANPNTVRALVVLGDDTLPADPAYGSRMQVSDDGFGTGLASRLLYAGRLYRDQADKGNQPLVIISAGPQPQLSAQEAGEARLVVNQLVNVGVPAGQVIIDPTGLSVRNSAIATERLLLERGFRKGVDTIILVSPSLITRRATSAFSQLGLKVIPRPTDFFAFQVQQPNERLIKLSDLIPNVEALALTTRAMDEYLTSIYYFMRGWLLDPIGF